MSEDVGPKEAALRLMREAKLKQIMNPTNKKLDYAGKGPGDNHPPGTGGKLGGRPKGVKANLRDPKKPVGRPKGWRKPKAAE